MKRILVALATIAGTGAVCAQSSVTLFGIMDTTFQRLYADGNGQLTRLHRSGYADSRLGFRGTEDLGGGLTASFWMEAQVWSDQGGGGANNSNNQLSGAIPGGEGLNFNRRSTLSLSGNFGEIRVGRDFVPSVWNLVYFDPMYTSGVGSVLNLVNFRGGTLTAAPTGVRASNSIGYLLPKNLGGFYGQAMYALGENLSTSVNKNDGRYLGGRIGYASGPLDVAVGYGTTEYATGDYRMWNIGGQWKFGSTTVMGQYERDQWRTSGAPDYQATWLVGAIVPVGAGAIRMSYSRTNVSGTPNDADQIALGYVHNLSKRTAVYASIARLDNKGTGTSFSQGLSPLKPGGSTRGYDLGIRHTF